MSTQLAYGSVRHRLPLEAWAGTELAQLQQLPMVVATEPYPSHIVTQAFQVSAGNVPEQFGNVGHEFEWGQLFNVYPLAVLHGLYELVDPHLPLLAIQRADLISPIAADYVGEVLFPARGHIVRDIVHRIVTVDASAMFPRSSGGGSISPGLASEALRMSTYLWRLHPLGPSHRDPDWCWEQCSPWWWSSTPQWCVEADKPAAGKGSPGPPCAFLGWASAAGWPEVVPVRGQEQ